MGAATLLWDAGVVGATASRFQCAATTAVRTRVSGRVRWPSRSAAASRLPAVANASRQGATDPAVLWAASEQIVLRGGRVRAAPLGGRVSARRADRAAR